MARILFVEDDDEQRQLGAEVLEAEGHVVTQAEDGLRAIDKFQRDGFDLVVTDILMPNMEGIETISKIRKTQPGIPVVALSGGGRKGNLEFLEMAKKLGAVDTLAKPYGPDDLISVINRCLAASE